MKRKTDAQQMLEGARDHLKKLSRELPGRGEKMQYDDLDLMIEVDRILRERAARKGGRASKKAQGLILALQCVPDKRAKYAWRYLEQYSRENPFKVAGYSIYIDGDKLIQINPAGKKHRPIEIKAFRRYCSES